MRTYTFKDQNFYIYSKIGKVDFESLKPIFEEMVKNDKIAIASPKFSYKGKVVDNYRNFPKFLDLFIKNFKFLRKRFPEQMRRYLLWDLDLNSKVNVDFLTNNFLIIKKDFFDQFKVNLGKSYSDIELAIKAYENNLSVCFFGTCEIKLKRRLKNKSFFLKLGILLKTFKFFIKNNTTLKNIDYPSKHHVKKLKRVYNTYKLDNKSFISKLGNRFQKNNPVIQVYDASINSSFNYKQPIIFWKPGVSVLLTDENNRVGLIKIWRHAPLKVNRPNLFPVFPDNLDLGDYFIETIRGGVEKEDSNSIESGLREALEEINLKKSDVVETAYIQKIIPNTAIDVSSVDIVHVKINSENLNIKLQKEESIANFEFYSKKQLIQMIRENKIRCSITLATLNHFLIQ